MPSRPGTGEQGGATGSGRGPGKPMARRRGGRSRPSILGAPASRAARGAQPQAPPRVTIKPAE
jgi:hypothetical protein